jgi:nitrogen-specific signal transduction histidine kinase
MSDSFVVVSDDGTIADLNKTFVDTFKPITDVKDKDNFFELIEKTGIANLEEVKKDIAKTREKGMLITKEYHLQVGDFDRYFEIDCQPVKAKSGNEYIASLILIRDVTAQKRDMEIMTKNENLVILGELAGGVAHDINTPIAAIKS